MVQKMTISIIILGNVKSGSLLKYYEIDFLIVGRDKTKE